MGIHDYIRTDSDNSFIVRGLYFDDYHGAWSAALGMWQASRYGLPSDNSNLSDAAILLEIKQDIQSLLTVKEMWNDAQGLQQ